MDFILVCFPLGLEKVWEGYKQLSPYVMCWGRGQNFELKIYSLPASGSGISSELNSALETSPSKTGSRAHVLGKPARNAVTSRLMAVPLSEPVTRILFGSVANSWFYPSPLYNILKEITQNASESFGGLLKVQKEEKYISLRLEKYQGGQQHLMTGFVTKSGGIL